MKLSRRKMLMMMGSGIFAAGLPRIGLGAASGKRIGIALQLYSVRNQIGQDADKVLAEIARMGYEAVEFAGYFKYRDDAAGLRKALDANGLKVAGTHVGDRVLSDPKAIEFHRAIGCKYLIVPGDGRVRDAEKSKEFAEILNKAAETLKPHGLCCGYHNHTHEFGASGDGDKTWWDLLAERTRNEVVLQMDVGHLTRAGRDPVAYLKKYPGRTRTAHISPAVVRDGKDVRPIIGQDSVPWKEVVAACREVGGTEWFIVEQENYLPGKTPLECSELSLKGLKTILGEKKS